MKALFLRCLFMTLFAFASAYGQEARSTQAEAIGEEKAAVRTAGTALVAYTKWRDESLPKYAQREQTPHYALAIVAERLDDNSAQVELLVAAEMKHYTITIRPVTLSKQNSGEVTTEPAGKAVVIDQKAGQKLTAGADKIRIGDITTIVPVSKAAQALEITWSPKNDTKDDPSNTCIVRLGKEPAVMVNGYIAGEPVR
jgi:hypothetical protein